MSITDLRKSELIKEYALSDNDTGSAEVQCAILTERIKNLTNHMNENRKDFASRRGLLILVGRRRRLLNYLKKNACERYNTLIARLHLRK